MKNKFFLSLEKTFKNMKKMSHNNFSNHFYNAFLIFRSIKFVYVINNCHTIKLAVAVKHF